MRSKDRDSLKVVRFPIVVGYFTSGGTRGMTEQGIMWSVIRNALGQYVYTFEYGIPILSVVGIASGGVIFAATINQPAANSITVDLVTHAGAGYDSQHQMFVTALDKRLCG